MDHSIIYLDERGYQEHLKTISYLEKEIEYLNDTMKKNSARYGKRWRDSLSYFDMMRKEVALSLKLTRLKNIAIEHVVPSGEPDVVDIGSVVTYSWCDFDGTNVEHTILLVSTTPVGAEISVNSPEGRDLWHRKVGDSFCEGCKRILRVKN